ncbi:MAG: hypothetical protein LBU91_09530 [Bacteroidales bacterium]|jgi:hypothetical protein|nr:hypothetical protein [Bacteroidales bacterium]
MKTLTFKLTMVSAVLLMLAGIFCSCKEKEKTSKVYSTTEGKVDINETEFVKLYFSPESGSINSPVELILGNHTEGVLTFGQAFSLEYFDDENWTEVQLDINFEDIGLSLEAGGIRKGMFNLSLIDEYNNGKKGKYRYVKKFGLSYKFPFVTGETFPLYAEFEIK